MSMSETYETAVETALRGALAEWAEKHETDGEQAVAEFVQKVTENSGWGQQGPFAYHLGWSADDVIAAELRSTVAQVVRRGLDLQPEIAARDIHVEGMKVLDRCKGEALTGGRSTNPWSNTVTSELGRQAAKMSDDDFGGYGTLAQLAEWQVARDLTRDEADALRVAKHAMNDASRRYDRARSEASKQKIEAESVETQAAVDAAQAALDARRAEFGIVA